MPAKDAKAYKIRYADLDDLHPAPWNPPKRISERNLRPLVDSIRKYGFWEFEPLKVAKGNIIADGNRRYQAARSLGMDQVPVVDIEIDAQEFWAQFNGTTRPTTIREIGEAVRLGLTHVPPAHERVFTDLLEVYGGDWEAIRKLCEKGASPSIVRVAQRVANYVGMGGDNEFIARTLRWLMAHHTATTARQACADGIDPATLFQKIADDLPLKNRWD